MAAQDASSKGLFISFEGGEGSGKTTQIDLLKDYLSNNGLDPVITREPGGTREAEKMREILMDHNYSWPPVCEAMILFSARAHHVDKLIRPALEKGQTVICDRFTDSTRAYQGVAMGLGLDLIEKVKKIAIGDLEPDITFFMDISPKKGIERAHKRSMETGEGNHKYEHMDMSFHQTLYEAYQYIAQDNPGRCSVIDADQEIEEIHNDILSVLEEKMK